MSGPQTLYEAFAATAFRHADKTFLKVPARAGRAYHPTGFMLTYGAAFDRVTDLIGRYRAAGYGPGHRVALMLDNRPEHFLHQIALNGLGVGQVPVNPDYLAHELAYLLSHSEVDLAVCHAGHRARLTDIADARDAPLPVCVDDNIPDVPPLPRSEARDETPGTDTEAAIVYTSGTTGHPKGCILDNSYHLTVGTWYAELGGRLTLEHGRETLFVPLPVYHVNAGINTLTAIVLTANCLVMPDRFHPASWWRDLIETEATGFHYLGVVPPLLMKAPPSAEDRAHSAKFGLGAGLDPLLHKRFEDRFGVAMVEVWGMTETGRFLADAYEPRAVETRAIGRPTDSLLARVVDAADIDVPRGEPGELVVRAAGDDPRHGFFRGYLKNPEATETAWRGGWFHTGDVVTQDATGRLYFVERQKNIIRRSGENISAAEVENELVDHDAVAQVAVLAIDDTLRDEEVMAAIVPAAGAVPSEALARSIFDASGDRLAYFKRPGWVVFVDALPKTGTQKVQKALIFGHDEDPRDRALAFDLRSLKKRPDAA
ncbi:MAG: AMP-binding protein [Pseudomonadota bacterium]